VCENLLKIDDDQNQPFCLQSIHTFHIVLFMAETHCLNSFLSNPLLNTFQGLDVCDGQWRCFFILEVSEHYKQGAKSQM
jgi:hypothetical protein